jgi:SNF2 family DNA or RNA helicase
MTPLPKDLPADYRQLSDIPTGIRISDRIQTPVLRIVRNAGNNLVSLEARVMAGGLATEVGAPSLAHNWVLHRSRILPLPVDVPKIVAKLIGEADPENLSLPNVLRVQREARGLIRVEIHESVFQTANERAQNHSGDLEVPGLKAALYPYQVVGVKWMKETLKHTGGVILADEMGLGKTMQIISLFLLDPPSDESPALIVCPTTLITNWCREIGKFAPSLTMLVHRGSDRAGVYTGLKRAQIVITTYDTLVNDIILFESVQWSFAICDEAQAIKNPSSQRRQALVRIPREKSIPVTGTPVENSLSDLWSLCDFAIPGLLGTHSEFELLYSDDADGADAVANATNPIVLKRRVCDVANDLPERIDIDLPLELNQVLAEKYEEIRQETIVKYPKAGALVATGQLSIFCAHPLLRSKIGAGGDWEEPVCIRQTTANALDTPKIECTISLLEEAFAVGRKVLIFANYNSCGTLIRKAATGLRRAWWSEINGSTPQGDRQTIVDEFSAHEGPAALVLNPRAAGNGLNITAATVVIHFTQVWNPALEMQASARAHRRGQTQPVTIYRLYYVNTVEEVMLERCAWKRALAATSVPISTREDGDLSRALSISPINK